MSAKRAAASKPSRFVATQQTKKSAVTTAAPKGKSAPRRATKAKAPAKIASAAAKTNTKTRAKTKTPIKIKDEAPKRAAKPAAAASPKAAAKVPAAAPVVAPTPAPKSAPPKRAPTPAKAAAKVARAPASTGKDKPMQETAKPAARAVVRIARGLRTPKHAPAAPSNNDAPAARGRPRDGAPTVGPRRTGPKIEVNPRLERSKHLVKGGVPAEAATAPKPMSVAAKHRAAAEAVFARLTVPETKPEGAPAPEATPLPFSARPPDQGGGSFTMRVNEHDSAVTALRLASNRDETLAAARNLAERFKLPPDQSLLLRVVALGDGALTKLALEELLELEDRGRVRPSPELKSVLGALETTDPETREIKQLLLEKIGVH